MRIYICLLLLLPVLVWWFMPLPARAEDDVFGWVKIEKPGARGNVVVSPSEVSQIAVGRGGTIYALDNENSRLYRSRNAGATWEDITVPLVSADAVLPASLIVVAPDTASTVAVVTNNSSQVYLSTDGGNTWTDTNVPGIAGSIQAIAISRQYTEADESLREIAIGTAAWGDNTTTGQVWVLQPEKLGAAWQNQNLSVDGSYTGGEVSAIAYSPNYHRDNTIVVVASSANDVAAGYQDQTWLCIGRRDTTAATTAWNALSGYPVEIATPSSPSAGDAPGVSRISSSLALPANYSGSQELLRRLFVSYDRDPDASDDVYRLDDTFVYRLNAKGGVTIDVSRLAYYGTTSSGKLLAGDVSPVAGSPTVQVRRTTNPFDDLPVWRTANMPPTGPGNARLTWSPEGALVFAGTGQSPGAGLDESAFSVSSDGGDNWQQLSLMDTTIMLSDIVPTPDSDTVFVATYSSFGPEGIWRSTRTRAGLGWYWSRQLTMNTTSNRIILRLSPDYASDYTIYAAEADGNLIAVSHNRGNSWQWRYAFEPIVDMVVEDEDTVYVAQSGGYIRKSITNVWSWTEPVRTGLPSINMLSIPEQGTVLAGGQNGEVAYSTDGGASFTRIPEAIGGGDVLVVADASYPQNGIIYTATDESDGGIWRWRLGSSTRWEQIDKSTTALGSGQRIGGLAMGAEGTLYALRMEAASDNSGGIARSLNPAVRDANKIEFDLANDGLPAGSAFDPSAVFAHALPYLKLSAGSGQNDLWAIDTVNEAIYRFQDSLSRVVPALDKPANGEAIPATMGDGGIYPTLHWKAILQATEYEVAVYLDADGRQRVWSGSSTTAALALTPDNRLPLLGPGSTYYWQVRAIKPLKSSWSEAWSFTSAATPVSIATNSLTPVTLQSPAIGADDVPIKPVFVWSQVDGASGYELVLASDGEFNEVVVALTGEDSLATTFWMYDEELDSATTYFWRVRAINATVHSAWQTGIFTTVARPVAKPVPIVIQLAPSSVDIEHSSISSPVIKEQSSPSVPAAPSATPPSLPPNEIVPLIPSPILWVAIGISAALVVGLVVLIVRTRA